MSSLNASEDWLEKLKRQYLQTLTDKIRNLETLVESLGRNPDDWETFDQLATAVHKIHGSAGTYGFDEITHATTDWERKMITVQKERRELTAGEMDQIHDYLQRIKSLVLKVLENNSQWASPASG